MGKKILVFTGAGISVPLGLPSTNEFITTINKIQGELLSLLKTFLNENDIKDIERILYLLEDFVREDDFTSHIVQQGTPNNGNFHAVYAALNNHKHYAKLAIEQIKADLFVLLEKYDADKASKLYSSIIKELKIEIDGDTAISFFTTNYDLTFENGFADDENNLKDVGIDEIMYGFQAKNGKATYNPIEDFNWDSNKVEYKKLHGSLDWSLDRNGNCIKTGATTNPKEPAKMPMLYPGFKGTPSKQPFIDLHEKLDQRLNDADVVFVIGFAFRDDYINNIFDYSLKKQKDKLIVLCYNPCPLDSYPKDSKVKYFVEKYPDNFFRIESRIDIKQDPLNLRMLNEKILNRLKLKEDIF
ncbi:MAG TPA: SIR2 family protein [Bacteroidia bacterium]|jgi:hypothetical protein|nr:SIR2 family protein [Bacteroidia bacterium]